MLPRERPVHEREVSQVPGKEKRWMVEVNVEMEKRMLD